MLNTIRTNLARILAPNTNPRNVEAPRPSRMIPHEAPAVRPVSLALDSVSMADPVEGAYVVAEAFGEWYRDLPAEARRVVRWNLAIVDSETVGDLVFETIANVEGARID